MPPQPGMFAIPYASHKSRIANGAELHTTSSLDYHMAYHHAPHHHTSSSLMAGPSSRPHGAASEEAKKDRRRKEIAGRMGKEMNERREDSARHYAESISALHSTVVQLAARPETLSAYTLRLYPISLERSALLAQLAVEERNALESAQAAYDLERERVEEEWKKGRERIRERLLEGIEERRRRARDEKDGEGTVGDASLDSQSRPHITRKLRNKLGTSPPPTPVPTHLNGIGANGNGPFVSGTVANPHSLSVDELPSPFPLPLTSVAVSSSGTGTGAGASGRRRAKGGGFQAQAVGGLGKSVTGLSSCKDIEIEADLGEILRGNKRRRVAAGALAGKA